METSVTVKIKTKYQVPHRVVKTGIIVESSEIDKLLQECDKVLKLINK